MNIRDAKRRIRLYGGILGIMFSILILRLFFLQIVNHDYYRDKAYWHKHRPQVLSPLRGAILDRQGTKLAVTEPAFNINLHFSGLTRHSFNNLSELLSIPQDDLIIKAQAIEEDNVKKTIIQKMAGFSNLPAKHRLQRQKELIADYYNRPYPLCKDLNDFEKVANVYIFNEDYPGLAIEAEPLRKYPMNICPHVLGYMGYIYKEEYESELREKGYTIRSLIGRAGLEKVFEDVLRGQSGEEVINWDAFRKERGHSYRIPPLDGCDIYLTIDAEIQKCAEEALDASVTGKSTGAAAVVMDVNNGEVIVLATSPRFDNNKRSTLYKELLEDPQHPLVNRAITNVRLPSPGSVFKIINAIAGLEEGILSPSDTSFCPGYLFSPHSFRCNGRHGTVDLVKAIECSCNVYFYKLGEKLGEPRLVNWSRKFGFGGKTGLETGEESAGYIPTAEWKQKVWKEPWYPGDSRFFGIGQLIEVTPIQVAVAMAAVATGGRVPRPHIVREFCSPKDSSPQPYYKGSFVVNSFNISSETLRIVRQGMYQVVYGDRGTARSIANQVKKYGVIGKTGTAECGKSGEGDHAWFAGYAPYWNPRYSFAVFVEHGGHGGVASTPVTAKIMTKLFTKYPEEEKN